MTSPAFAGAGLQVSPSGEQVTEFNGSCYAYIPSFGIDFDQAINDASTKSVNGVPEPLAAYESPAEEAISDATGANAKGWIGYTQDGNFASGPYAGDGFGWIDSSPQTHSNWAGGEPNDSGGNEDYTETQKGGLFCSSVLGA
jgi:hypothetical protein